MYRVRITQNDQGTARDSRPIANHENAYAVAIPAIFSIPGDQRAMSALTTRETGVQRLDRLVFIPFRLFSERIHLFSVQNQVFPLQNHG